MATGAAKLICAKLPRGKRSDSGRNAGIDLGGSGVARIRTTRLLNRTFRRAVKKRPGVFVGLVIQSPNMITSLFKMLAR